MDIDKEAEAKKLFDEAENYFKQNDYFNAIMCLEKAIEIYPNEFELYDNLYDTYSKQEQFDKAIKQYKDAIEVTSNDPMLYKSLGICYFKQKKYDEAINQYKKGLEVTPNDLRLYKNLSICYFYQKKYDKTVEVYKKVLDIAPNDVEANFSLGYIYSKQEKYIEAIEQYKKGLLINPNDAVLYTLLGDAYNTLEEYDRAIKAYKRAIKINSNYSEAFENLASIYYKQEKYDKSLKLYKKILLIKPGDHDALFYLSAINYILEQYDEAIKVCNKAISIYPTDEWAHYGLSLIYCELKNYDELLKNIILYCSKLSNGNRSLSGILKVLVALLSDNSTLNECYRVIFKDETIFDNDKIFTSIIDKKSTEYDKFKKIWFYQAYLLEKMAYKELDKDTNNYVVHYTSYNTLMYLIGENDEDDKEKVISKVRLNSLSTANDNEEGHTLLHIFRDLNIHVQQSENNNLVPFQTSFSKNKDSLTMFRLYGKEGDKEATGVCLVFNNDFFTNDTSIDQQPVKLLSPFDEEKSIEKVTKENPKRSLYHILYYNPDDKQLLFNRKETKHGQNEIINLGDNSANDSGEIQECFNEIIKFIKGANDKQTCYDLLINLKYLIKSDYWLEETELRLIEIADLNDSDNGIITDKPNNKLYKEYLDVFGNDKKNPYLKAIILGSKIDNAESKAQVIKRWLVEKGYTTIDVSVSKAPLR